MGRPDLVWNYDKVTGSGPLHIADKSCKYGAHEYTHSLTRCGRPMYPDFHAWNMRGRTLADFRLCRRCGTLDEFAQALREHNEWQSNRKAERDEQSKAEENARLIAQENRLNRIRSLASFLVESGARVGVDSHRGVAIIEHDGYEFKVEERGLVGSTD